MTTMRERLVHAFQSPSLPCNPIPFAKGLSELVKDTGSDGIMSDEAKAMLWILNVQAYGQFGEIDLSKEWSRLDKAIGEPAHDNN